MKESKPSQSGIRLSDAEREQLSERYGDDPLVRRLLAASRRADGLLERALWEFGGELRGEIEAYLGETPLLPRG